MDETPEKRETDEVPPWEQEGAVRRDCEPHRSGMLLGLARGSLALGVMALCVWWLAPGGLLLGIVALLLGRRDLAAMGRGDMDPDGELDSGAAVRKAKYGLVLCVAALALWGLGYYVLVGSGR